MKIQIDFDKKLIKIEDTVNLKELYAILEKLLPKNQWHDFDLECHTTITNWSSPIVIERNNLKPYLPHYYNDITLCNFEVGN